MQRPDLPKLQAIFPHPLNAQWNGGGGAVFPPSVLRVRVPAISELTDIMRAAQTGLWHTAMGCFIPLVFSGDEAPGYYAYFTVDGIGVDPGPSEAQLAGMAGIEVALSAGAHDRTAVAAALETAINGEAISGLTVENGGEYLDLSGAGLNAVASEAIQMGPIRTHMGISRTYGMRGWRPEGAGSSASATSGRCMILGRARCPRVMRVVGWYCVLGSHGAGNEVSVALYRGSGSTPDSYTLVADLGATTGTATGLNIIRFSPSDVIEIDLGASDHIAVAYKTDTLNLGFVSTASSAASNSMDYITSTGGFGDGGNGIYLMTGAPSGSASAWPSAWTTVASSVAFYSAVGLIVQSPYETDGVSATLGAYYSDFNWESNVGPQYSGSIDTTMHNNTAPAAVRVAWPYSAPAVEDLEAGPYVRIGYGTFGSPPFDVEIGAGGAANNDFIGATRVYHALGSGGSNETYLQLDIPDGDHYPVPASTTRLWYLLHRPAGGTTTIRFGASATTHRDPPLYALGAAVATGWTGSAGELETEDNTAGPTSGTPVTSPWERVAVSFDYPGNLSAHGFAVRVRRTVLMEANPE